MFITELRFPNLTVDIPATSDIGLLFLNHLNSIGKSPDETVQETLTVSPKLAGASPKSKFAILGGTKIIFKKIFKFHGETRISVDV